MGCEWYSVAFSGDSCCLGVVARGWKLSVLAEKMSKQRQLAGNRVVSGTVSGLFVVQVQSFTLV